VRLSVPRLGGVRAWGLAAEDFDRRLAGQASTTVSGPRVEGETRRGRDYLRVTVVMDVVAEDIGQALVTAWWAFQKAADGDMSGWDAGGASAEVRPA
jgi:hypothetical protein